MLKSHFTKPPPEDSSSDESAVSGILPKRKANLYDAVAGKVTQAGLIGNIKSAKSSKQPLRPDEVLFKQASAPIRYEETDYYFAHANLPATQPLPSGDLLSALHAYISKLYARTEELDAPNAFKCMDETALIAFGILMEETARELLGDTGDLAFTEAADQEEERALKAERGEVGVHEEANADDDEEEEGEEEEEEGEKNVQDVNRSVSRDATGRSTSESSSDESSDSTEDSE